MNVQSSTRRRALLDIYQTHRKPRGGSLSARELERDWKQTGLRRSDLELALKDMTQRQLLLPRRAHEGTVYELTYLGECAMKLLMAGGPVAMLRDWLTLQRAKRRRLQVKPSDSDRHNRRASDRHAAAQGSAEDKAPESMELMRR